MNLPTSCPFRTIADDRVVDRNDLAFVLRDAYPVPRGHTLVIPCRHVPSFFDTTREERAAMLELLDRTTRTLDSERTPADYSVGINDGPAAG